MMNFINILLLILAGEVIFSLPFHITRFFRPTFLNEFGLTNTQLGDMFSAYGVVAFLSYFPGGILADKFETKNLISTSLLLTSLGGFYLYSGPSSTGLYFLFAYWGATTILLFWAALIKATREWGGEKTQGFAFGVLDGGRGLVASLMATILIFFLGKNNSQNINSIIFFYTIVTITLSVLAFYFIPKDNTSFHAESDNQISHNILTTIKNKNLWFLSGIVVCAYCGYKSLDNYGLYSNKILGLNDIDSAKVTTYISYSRAVIAIIAGLFADKFRAKSLIIWTFSALALSSALFLITPASSSLIPLLIANLSFSAICVYAIRAVYFALIEEIKVSKNATGTAVGIISVVGYTPDIFFASITGRLLDMGTTQNGFQLYFGFIFLLSLIGALFSWRLKYVRAN